MRLKVEHFLLPSQRGSVLVTYVRLHIQFHLLSLPRRLIMWMLALVCSAEQVAGERKEIPQTHRTAHAGPGWAQGLITLLLRHLRWSHDPCSVSRGKCVQCPEVPPVKKAWARKVSGTFSSGEFAHHDFLEMLQMQLPQSKGFPHSSAGKESACNAGDPGSIPRSGRPLEKG